MIARIQRWGNSQGLRVSKQLLEDARLDVGDEVDLTIRDGEIVVTPVHRVRGRHDLRELVKDLPKDYAPEPDAWADRAGKEAW